MPLVPTAELVVPGTGIGAFNVITLEHAEAIVAGATAANRPVILQISENAVRFHAGALGPVAAAARAVAGAATVGVALHLDHVKSPDLLRQAPEHGFGSVMADFSELSYLDNVAATREAAEFAHGHGLWIESELGAVGGKDGAPPPPPHAPGARTDPAEAADYVKATGVDALAVAVGSSHAMTSRGAELDFELIAALRAAVPVPLVLHGSSGVTDAGLRRAVAAGIVKVNVGTALNVAFTGAVRGALAADPAVVDPRRYLAKGRDAMAGTVAAFLSVLA
ncbi:class II fructose-bisphosphate aldolase family protein [Rugosimonospora acidiphila]|uniref:Class II fructose-bisphosphate aldolase family protein n=1 Tax=Rugosimonospora acidiphila TaxID=556531 RepID=A0ABP9SMZ2_9ACTN